MKELLIVVDFQNDFVDGALGFPKASEIEDYILARIKKARDVKEDIIFTLDTHDKDYLNTEEGKNLPCPHCLKNSKGHELYGKVKEVQNLGLVFEKDTFGSRKLLEYLIEHPYDKITLLGLVSNMCVFSNAVIAKTACPNAHILIDSKGSRSFDEDLENKCYEVAKGLQIEII